MAWGSSLVFSRVVRGFVSDSCFASCSQWHAQQPFVAFMRWNLWSCLQFFIVLCCFCFFEFFVYFWEGEVWCWEGGENGLWVWFVFVCDVVVVVWVCLD